MPFLFLLQAKHSIIERGSIFQIMPAEREISPNSTVAFTITFWPVYYTDTLTCSIIVSLVG